VKPLEALLCVALACAAAPAVACSSPPTDPAPARGTDPNGCATCHLPEYVATTHPAHAGAKPLTCGVCHASSAWHPSRLDHPFWALTGAHEKTACFECHRGAPPVFHGTSKVCVDCHRADYDRSMFPEHSTFPLTCEECHTTTAWKPSTWKSLPASPSPAPLPTPTPTLAPGSLPAPAHKKAAPTPPRPAPTPTPRPPDVVTHPSPRR
jgi:hypothetical protein